MDESDFLLLIELPRVSASRLRSAWLQRNAAAGDGAKALRGSRKQNVGAGRQDRARRPTYLHRDLQVARARPAANGSHSHSGGSLMAKKSAHSVDVLVGQNIRITRLRRGLSQSALAGQVGITFQQIQKYERGDNRVGASRLLQIADALQVSLPTLFEGIATAGQTAQPDDSSRRFLADGRAMRLAQAFDRVSGDEMRLALVHLVEAIVEARARQR